MRNEKGVCPFKEKVRLLTVGSTNMDFIMKMEHVPVSGETMLGEDYVYSPGGKGANTAVAAARLGAQVEICTAIGKDTHGDVLLAGFEKEGLGTRYLRRTGKPTGLAAIMLEPDGANRIVVFSGANNEQLPADAAAAVEDMRPDGVLFQLETPDEVLFAAFEKAKACGIPCVLDMGPARKLDLGRLRGIEILSPNESETEAFTGIVPKDAESAEKAARLLKKRSDARYIVLKLGARGCCVLDGNCFTAVSAYPSRPVDTTAAGDSFTAALMTEYLRSGSILEAADYACAVGALTVSGFGAQPSLPHRERVEKFRAEHLAARQ